VKFRGWPSFPRYPVEDCTQASSLLDIDTFHEAYSTRQVFPEMRMGFAVLGGWTVADTIREYRLE
jgi:hypothetical protein